jgi:hypothetical protein
LQHCAQRFPHQFAIVHDEESSAHQKSPARLIAAQQPAGANILQAAPTLAEIIGFSPWS